MRRTPPFSLLRTSATLFLLTIATIATAISASTAPAFEEAGASEFVTVYADDCATPKTVFNPGEVVCVKAGNFPLASDWGYRYRRFSWVAPDRQIMDQTNIKADPQFDRFAIPGGATAGTWYVTTLDVDSSRYANARFVVRRAYSYTTDLSIFKDGPETVFAGQRVEYMLQISNPGPDAAEGIEFVTEVPSNMTFVAFKQASGAFFDCRLPVRGGVGRIYCSTKGMQLDERAVFYAYYDVSREVKEGEVCSSNTEVTSYTEELRKEDNLSVSQVRVALETPPDLEEPPPGDGK
ncbi:MAG TPA: hypothetical protein VEZ40_12985 [Pyrinomonadaceae bacterium]|nr:hypothetical protein [Pyrinomonadaceae bacterium]